MSRICVLMWGLHYRSEAARQLGVHLRTFMRWDAGERRLPPAQGAKLVLLLRQHRAAIDTALRQIERSG